MKVSIASGGRFHMFDLARQMKRLAHLDTFYTAYPKGKIKGLPQKQVRTYPWLMTPAMLIERLGFAAVRRVNPLLKITFDRWMASRLNACDVFHCLSGWGLESHRVAKKKYGTLTVCDRGSSHITYQNELLAEEYSRWGVPFHRTDQRVIERELQEYKECDLIMVPSTFAYRSFIQKGVMKKKLIKLPYGVDLGTFKPMPKEDSKFRVVYVGSLNIRKGIPYLLQALESLRISDMELWLIGPTSPEAKPFLEGYKGCYTYFGFLPLQELFKYYSQGSVFVLPSVEDGFGLVQAQAMACGLPVIATTNTGAEDLFTDGVEGFIVPPRSPEAISEKLLYLYENPESRKEMSRAALQRVRGLTGWNTYGEEAANVYRNALEPVAVSAFGG